MFADLILSTVIKQILATRIHSQPSSNNISSVFGISKHEKILLAIAIHPRSAPVGWRETKFAYRILSEYFSAYARYIAHYDSCGLMPGSNSRFVVRARYTVDRHWLCVRNLKKKRQQTETTIAGTLLILKQFFADRYRGKVFRSKQQHGKYRTEKCWSLFWINSMSFMLENWRSLILNSCLVSVAAPKIPQKLIFPSQ